MSEKNVSCTLFLVSSLFDFFMVVCFQKPPILCKLIAAVISQLFTCFIAVYLSAHHFI